MLPRQYYFIRHAVQNGAGSFHPLKFDSGMKGEIDEPLSEIGRCQSAILADAMGNLKIECIVSSTRKRAAETAGILSKITDIPFRGEFEELEEISLGSYPVNSNILLRLFMSGIWPQRLRSLLDRSLNVSLSAYYYMQWFRGKTAGAESAASIYERVSEMLAILDTFSETRIAAVGHAGWISFMALKLLGESQLNILRLKSVNNCSVTRINADGRGKYKIHFFARPLWEFTGSAAYDRMLAAQA